MRRFKFHRSDGEGIVVFGRSPMHAWETLCERLEDDYFYIQQYLNSDKNASAISKGYKWLNSLIDPHFRENFGPVFCEL